MTKSIPVSHKNKNIHVALSGQFHSSVVSRLSNHNVTISSLDQILETERGNLINTLITRGSTHVNAALFDQLENLKLVVKAGSGLDTIDVKEASSRGVTVTRTGGSAHSVAELSLALLFDCLRNTRRLDVAVRRGDWAIKNRLVGTTLSSRNVGVIGYGEIGQAFAGMVAALGAKVSFWDRSPEKSTKIKHSTNIQANSCATLEELLVSSDTISIHLPSSSKTRGLIGEKEFTIMPHGSILVNTGRAEVVDRDALLKSLCNGTLAAAGLDVHYCEGSECKDDPIFALENVTITPHVGAQTNTAHLEIANRIVGIVEDHLNHH